MNNQTQSFPHDSDEIDLFELLSDLWQQRVIILVIGLLAFILATAYAWLTPKTYQATVTVLPPWQDSLQSINAQRQFAGFGGIKAEDVYALFKQSLASEELKRALFEKDYLPKQDVPLTEQEQQQKLKSFLKDITISNPDEKKQPELYQIAIQNTDPQQAYELLKSYLDLLNESISSRLVADFNSQVFLEKKLLSSWIYRSRLLAKQVREDRVVQLQDALFIAEAAKQDVPMSSIGKVASDGTLNNYINGAMSYMRGAKVLKAELDLLKNRSNDDPFIDGFRDKESKLERLAQAQLDASGLKAYREDSPLLLPMEAIKPKKMLIMLIGAVAGLMLGVFVALLNSAWQKRKLVQQ